MVLISLLSGALLGRLDLVSAAAAKGAQSAVETVFTLAGPLCLWCGVGELMQRSGLRDRLGRLLRPLLGKLYPELKGNLDGFSALCANVTANCWVWEMPPPPWASPPAGPWTTAPGIPTRGQCRLVVMNTASIQLLPTTVAALRAGLGCRSPLDILPAVLLTSLCSVSAGLLACRLLEKLGR